MTSKSVLKRHAVQKGENMIDKDKLIELAKSAGFYVPKLESAIYAKGVVIANDKRDDIFRELIKFAELIQNELNSVHAIALVRSMQTEQPAIEPYGNTEQLPDAWMYVNSDGDCEEIGHVSHYDKRGKNPFKYNPHEMIEMGFKPLYTHPAPVTSMQGGSEPIISDAEIVEAFKNTRFGSDDHRKILIEGVRKTAINYHNGFTLTQIIRKLGLGKQHGNDAGANDLTEKGLNFLIQANDRVKGVSDSQKFELTKLKFFRDINTDERMKILKVFGIIPADYAEFINESVMRQLLEKLCSQLSTNTDGWVSVPKENQLLENWLNINMPAGTEIGDPKWWAIRIRNVLSCEARSQKFTNKDADTIGLIASREIMNVLVDAGVILFTSNKPQLQAKIQCAVINAISQPKGGIV